MCAACQDTGLTYTHIGEERICTCPLGDAAAEIAALAEETEREAIDSEA